MNTTIPFQITIRCVMLVVLTTFGSGCAGTKARLEGALERAARAEQESERLARSLEAKDAALNTASSNASYYRGLTDGLQSELDRLRESEQQQDALLANHLDRLWGGFDGAVQALMRKQPSGSNITADLIRMANAGLNPKVVIGGAGECTSALASIQP